MFIVYAADCKAYDESNDYRSVAQFKALKMQYNIVGRDCDCIFVAIGSSKLISVSCEF